MKNLFNFKMKTLCILLLSSLTLFSSCNNTENSKSLSDNKEVQVKPPSVDLHTATFMGNVEAIKQHIAAGSDLNVKDPFGSTALITACVFGRTNIALELIEGGADLNLQNNDGSTPLHCSTFFCHTEITESLLTKGADKNIPNNDGSIPYEGVKAPFSEVKAAYDFFAKELGPLGLKLDYKHIEKTRPVIAEMLK